jgi:glycosyltransferase involved in cell wall biosynthesis
LAGLRERKHEIKIVSHLDINNFWHGAAPLRRLWAEVISVQREMKGFSADAWLTYGPSVKHPDFFGWWLCPNRYVLVGVNSGRLDKGKHVPKRWRWLFTIAHRRSLSRADKIAAFRPNTIGRLRSSGIPQEKLYVLPPAIRPWDSIPSRQEARRRLGLPLEAPIILCVSRLTVREDGDSRPGKSEAILELFAALDLLPPKILLLLVGDGPGRKQLEEEAAKLQHPERVQITGEVEHDDLRWFYAACDLFAFPDLRNLPRMAVLEAQACGRAVVTMENSSNLLTVAAGQTGLLAKDLKEFRAHVSTLVHDRDRRESMGRSGPSYITEFHSLDTRVRQIEDLLAGQRRRIWCRS